MNHFKFVAQGNLEHSIFYLKFITLNIFVTFISLLDLLFKSAYKKSLQLDNESFNCFVIQGYDNFIDSFLSEISDAFRQ